MIIDVKKGAVSGLGKKTAGKVVRLDVRLGRCPAASEVGHAEEALDELTKQVWKLGLGTPYEAMVRASYGWVVVSVEIACPDPEKAIAWLTDFERRRQEREAALYRG